MRTVARTWLRRAPSARMIATSRLRSSDDPTMLTRMPIADTMTTSAVTRSKSSSSGRTKRSSSCRISRTGSAACPSRPSLIACLRPIAMSSAGRPGIDAVVTRTAVTSRWASGRGAGRPPPPAGGACVAGVVESDAPSTGFAWPSWRKKPSMLTYTPRSTGVSVRARMPVTRKGSCTAPSSAPCVGENVSPTARPRRRATSWPRTPPKKSSSRKLTPAAKRNGPPSTVVIRSK